jgi:hypothetical protein
MSELWTVALFFRGHGRQVNLLYGGEAVARAAFDRIVNDRANSNRETYPIGDHYGTTIAVFDVGPIEAVMLQDNTKAHDGAIEGSLIQARAQAKANTRAKNDPQVKLGMGSGGINLAGRLG